MESKVIVSHRWATVCSWHDPGVPGRDNKYILRVDGAEQPPRLALASFGDDDLVYRSSVSQPRRYLS